MTCAVTPGTGRIPAGAVKRSSKSPPAVEREFPPPLLPPRNACRERETGGIDGKPAVVHGKKIVERECKAVGDVHHRRDPPGTAEHLPPLPDPGLRFEEFLRVPIIAVQGGLRFSEQPGDRNDVARPRTPPPPDEILRGDSPESRAHDRQFPVSVEVAANEFCAEHGAAVPCTLHDPGKAFRTVEADREEHLPAPRPCSRYPRA